MILYQKHPTSAAPVMNTTHGRTATVVPVYRSTLTVLEAQRLRVSAQNVPRGTLYFVGPASLSGGVLSTAYPHVPYIPFGDNHFLSVAAYNRWMLSPDLYQRFKDFDFLLILQTDAVLSKALPEDEPWDFDFLGAPWLPPWTMHWDPLRHQLSRNKPRGATTRILHVGNGGLSLRRTSMSSKLKKLPRFSKYPNEDIAISFFSRRLGIRIAPVDVAEKYFMESGASTWVPQSPIPDVYGFHALDKFNPALEALILSSPHDD